MTRRKSHRHPAVETAVFAAALLLAAFIARELWSRRGKALSGTPAAVQPAVPEISYPPLPTRPSSGRTETAVTGVAPIKLSRVQGRRPKTEPVPAPR